MKPLKRKRPHGPDAPGTPPADLYSDDESDLSKAEAAQLECEMRDAVRPGQGEALDPATEQFRAEVIWSSRVVRRHRIRRERTEPATIILRDGQEVPNPWARAW